MLSVSNVSCLNRANYCNPKKQAYFSAMDEAEKNLYKALLNLALKSQAPGQKKVDFEGFDVGSVIRIIKKEEDKFEKEAFLLTWAADNPEKARKKAEEKIETANDIKKIYTPYLKHVISPK